VWEDLGLVDYSTAPHYKSDHPESTFIDTSVAYFVKNNMPFKTLRDGDVLILQDSQLKK